jgi:hypothetical protein
VPHRSFDSRRIGLSAYRVQFVGNPEAIWPRRRGRPGLVTRGRYVERGLCDLGCRIAFGPWQIGLTRLSRTRDLLGLQAAVSCTECSVRCRMLVHFPSSFTSKSLRISWPICWIYRESSRNQVVGPKLEPAVKLG